MARLGVDMGLAHTVGLELVSAPVISRGWDLGLLHLAR